MRLKESNLTMDDGNRDSSEMDAHNSNASTPTKKTQSQEKEALNSADKQNETEDKEEGVNCLGKERSHSVVKEDLIDENKAQGEGTDSNLHGGGNAQSKEEGNLDLKLEEQNAQCKLRDVKSLEHQHRDAGDPGAIGIVDKGVADYPEGEAEEELEEDEPEGIKKALKKGYKAAKEFFNRSEEKGKGDNHQPLQHQVACRNDADEYDFTHRKRGRAVIINNEKFRPGSDFESRPGSEKDAADLKEVFKKLGFDVEIYNNLTAMEMKQAIEKEAHAYDHYNADCLAVAILSHGDSQLQEKSRDYYYNKAHPFADRVRRDLIFGVDSVPVSTASIMRTFQDERCPGLVGKPRLFFLQACRGGAYDDGVSVAVVPDGSEDEEDRFEDAEQTDSRHASQHHHRNITSPAPIFKDYLVMYATTPGHFAWRRPSGTWFVQSLHTVLTKHLTRHMSLTQALTRVARMVAQGYESNSNTPGMSGKKQTPVIESMLVKDIYFSKK